MEKSGRSGWKRGLATCLIFALSLVLVWQPVGSKQADAASSKEKYVKDVKIFTVKGSSDEAKKAAEDWCKSQKDGEWKVVDGDLNSGAAGALNKNVAVYLVYQTTTEPNEAITDLAVMNEQGSYSEGEYKDLIEKQKDLYKDMVSDLKDMLKEYRENVKNGVKTAVQSQKFMNGYVEDDSGKPLGDFLLDATDEQLVPVLMQANGQVVMMIQERLAYACDTGKSTWLERMEKLGSFDNLRAKALKSYNNNAAKADIALENKYYNQASKLLESWEDVDSHICHAIGYGKRMGIDKMSDEEYAEWIEKTADDEEAIRYRDEAAVMTKLASYKYEDGTLLDYFHQDHAKVVRDRFKVVYPLVACLTTGQKSAVNETVSLFTLILNASASAAFNDNNSEEDQQIEKDMTAEDKKAVEDIEKSMDENLDKWEDKKVSIYDGVDRDVFKDGVAVTSTAKNFSNAVERSWADALIENHEITPAMMGVAIGTGIFATGALVTAVCYAKAFKSLAEDQFITVRNYREGLSQKAYKAYFSENYELEAHYDELLKRFDEQYEGVQFTGDKGRYFYSDQSAAGKKKLLEKALQAEEGAGLKVKILKGLKIGFTVATILLSVADIVITGIALYKYYNKDHLPIPHHMVDLTYNDKKETSFAVYKSVLDTEGNYGDLNGGGGKQWLALYASRDRNAGDPIQADEFVVKKGTTDSPGKDYLPLHMFGKPNAAQNLTFADGENGWSYNDDENGTYLYFQNEPLAFIYDNRSETGTVISGGVIVLATAGGVLVGGILGFLIAGKRRKKFAK